MTQSKCGISNSYGPTTRWFCERSSQNIIPQNQPELAKAARSDPVRFSQSILQLRRRRREAKLERQRERDRLFEADPSDVRVHQKVEEAARKQAVQENMEYALKYTPEFYCKPITL